MLEDGPQCACVRACVCACESSLFCLFSLSPLFSKCDTVRYSSDLVCVCSEHIPLVSLAVSVSLPEFDSLSLYLTCIHTHTWLNRCQQWRTALPTLWMLYLLTIQSQQLKLKSSPKFTHSVITCFTVLFGFYWRCQDLEALSFCHKPSIMELI